MIDVIVKVKVTSPEFQIFEHCVQLHGYDRLTPKAARGALQVATGHGWGGEVWWNAPDTADYNYGYRVYKNSARKLHAEY